MIVIPQILAALLVGVCYYMLAMAMTVYDGLLSMIFSANHGGHMHSRCHHYSACRWTAHPNDEEGQSMVEGSLVDSIHTWHASLCHDVCLVDATIQNQDV
jgi:hypothetical protein